MPSRLIGSPAGPLLLVEDSGRLAEIRFAGGDEPDDDDTTLLTEAKTQLGDYFAGRRRAFDLPLVPARTDFQQRVREAMIAIRAEIREIEEGRADRQDNPLKRAPHDVAALMDDDWDRAYGRQVAAFPCAWVRERKFWPAVGRIDNAYGDRNLVCTCPPLEEYETK